MSQSPMRSVGPVPIPAIKVDVLGFRFCSKSVLQITTTTPGGYLLTRIQSCWAQSNRIDVRQVPSCCFSDFTRQRLSQVIISTGKSDWPKEVTEADGTLAAFLSSANERLQDGRTQTRNENAGNSRQLPPAGLFTQNDTRRLSIQNGSHKSFSEDPSQETVIVLPDFKVIADVPRSPMGAETLWTTALDPSYGRLGANSRSDSLRSWALPYSCVILLCSHKRRDKRCAVAAPVLEKTFIRYLEREGWVVHTGLEDLSGNPTIESSLIKGLESEIAFETQLKALGGEHKALILYTSHVGGHKFAGNVILHSPRGTSVWYGRITPHDVESIVKNTIINGQVLPTILRGGMNLARPGCETLHDW
ncbi:Sucrase/ferredoxin-like-domain-containing protein [Butyriboletus roseoflavus]|nr:Sucrase/ferredoxin-like-domain-containing protein [Butyriboletus roseoflavus]